jgi:hypothetical protein
MYMLLYMTAAEEAVTALLTASKQSHRYHQCVSHELTKQLEHFSLADNQLLLQQIYKLYSKACLHSE